MLKKLIGFIFRLILLALVIGVPCTWMLSRSYKNPEVHYYQVTQDRGEESLRFAVLSDLNGYIFAGGNSQIVEGVASVSPDAILMDGDMIDAGAENVSFLVSLIERLSSIAPVYYAYGEQEYLYATDGAANRSHRLTGETDKMLAFEKEITEAGATVIREGYQDVMLYGIPVRIGSTDESAVNYTMGNGKLNPAKQKLHDFLAQFTNSESYKILLAHNIDHFLRASEEALTGTDLIVSGHLIGGRVVLPYFGGVFGGAQGYFPEYARGVLEKDGHDYLLSAGLSAIRDRIPRLNNPPEITVLDVNGLGR